MSNDTLLPIPQPPEKPLLGNILDLGSQTQVQDLMRLARKYGEIFHLQIAGRRSIFVSSARLVAELCDESRFDKRIWAPLHNVRTFAGDGLFTAHTFEPNWKKAHHILLPAFSQPAIEGYHARMVDIARQLVERWQRLNPGDEVDVPDAMTRLTLDTIGLCGFDFRFNSFYRDRMHPFVKAMSIAMGIAMGRSMRPQLGTRLRFQENQRFRRAVSLMNETVDGIVRERRRTSGDGDAGDDLLGKMLVGVDKESGESLDDVNIRYQIITFLIAGHETTSGLLSFALYFLIKHPHVLEQVYDEVDRVFGSDPGRDPTYREVRRLDYTKQVLNESLRLWPTAPLFALFPKEGEAVIGGRYQVTKRDGLAVLTPMLHRDPEVWGPDAEIFNPDHFAPEAERERPPHAFKPFGNGQRACIGRQFAMHEAALALGMILQRFRLVDHLGYRLEIQESLTLKPSGFRVRIMGRDQRAPRTEAPVAEPVAPAATIPSQTATLQQPLPATPAHGTPLLVLFGSNLGTAEGVARRLADEGERRGFEVTAAPLDDYVGNLPSAGAVVVVSASYNGNPPDNATRFLAWLAGDEVGETDLAGVDYTVFGCGHRDWAATFQRVPTEIDRLLAEHGARRIHARGEGDGGGDFDADLERWQGALWSSLGEALDLDLASVDAGTAVEQARYEIELIEEQPANPFALAFGAAPMSVLANRELQSEGAGRSTRHVELELPAGATYRTGDHLGVLAHNDEELVQRALARLGFDLHTRLRIHQKHDGRAELPIDQAISLERLLARHVELQQHATRAQIQVLARHTECPPERDRLLALCGTGEDELGRYREEVLQANRSLLDLLEETPSCALPLHLFLEMLGPLRPRYYSISSSSLRSPRVVSLTVGVVAGPARSGRGTYRGVCSSYLARREPGAVVEAFVRNPNTDFRLPDDPTIPLVMIGPGTGIAPFRGFLEERAVLREQGQKLGPALLFFGCRRPEHDFLYREELEALERLGLVELVTAFSRLEDHKVYVQHRLAEHGKRVLELVGEGGRIYVCGDASGMAPAVRAAFAQLLTRSGGGPEPEVDPVAELEREGRYLVDVWASG